MIPKFAWYHFFPGLTNFRPSTARLIALVGAKETSDSNTSEVEIEISERVEDNIGRESRGGNSKELSVKME